MVHPKHQGRVKGTLSPALLPWLPVIAWSVPAMTNGQSFPPAVSFGLWDAGGGLIIVSSLCGMMYHL